MAPANVITKEDVYVKARILSEGLRVKGAEAAGYRGLTEPEKVIMPKKLKMGDPEEFVKFYADWILKDDKAGGGGARMGGVFKFDGSGLAAPITHNKYSRLELTVDGERVSVTDGGETLVTGTMPPPFAWLNQKLSNGMPAIVALPASSAGIINIVFSLSCMNYNTGRGCRYCNLFANPVSKKIAMLPKETLRVWARYQGEAVKIATDNGWRGSLAVSGGALPPAHRPEYMERLTILMDEIKNAVGEETLGKLHTTFNHYPPEDFNDMNDWKELGINATSFDLEVMDPAYFAAICPGKHAYKPHEYWREAQEASVEIFGPYLKTAGCIVVGVEPMSTLLKGTEERLSKGVMPLPLIFGSAPGSAYHGFRPPNADWQLETAEKMADIYLGYAGKLLEAQKPGGGGDRRESMPISLVFDVIKQRVQAMRQ